MTFRLSDIPTGDPTLQRWWADTKRALEQEFDTALVPAYRDGTNWRHWGTGTATF
jgi:hypothetical protein